MSHDSRRLNTIYDFIIAMTNITFSLSPATVRRLRQYVKRVHGSKKGVLSDLVEGAVRETMDKLERPTEVEFSAVKDGLVVARSASLNELTSILRKKGVDPRTVRIISKPPHPPLARLGLRTR